jgi:nucleoside-diphosphate-sugar epimerase
MKVLVTGGTGYLGRAIVYALAKHGHEPVVFARTATRSGLPGTLIDGDIRDRAAVTCAARDVEAICHTAALVSVWRRRREDFDEINVGGVRTTIDLCLELRIPKLVYTSSFLALPPADGDTPIAANDYQRTKVAARALVQSATERGAPIVTLVPGVVYGPGAATEGNLIGRLVGDHLAGRLPGLIGADRPWSFAFVEDVAAAHVAALERATPGREFVVGGINASQMAVFEFVRQLTGKAVPRRLPFAVAELAARVEEVRSRLTGRPPLLTRGVVEIFRHDWSLDSRVSQEALAHRITPLDQGLRATLAAMVEQGKDR